MSNESKPESNSSDELSGKQVVTQDTTHRSGDCPPSGGTLKQAINKEIETLIQSYIDYAKNVDL
ncbi:MAG: hypothetical protein H6Q72_4100 [Firmicutes bacterium]|nr:hypothetical protein [Bacillota bacterium]